MNISSLFCKTALLLLLTGTSHAGDMSVGKLRCEYLVDPMGIEAERPMLSWVISSDARGALQTHYQVLVASTQDKLAEDSGDLWDSGKVESGNTISVRYQGKPLASNQRCFWKVRVWDQEGQATDWSGPGVWSAGMLAPSDWVSEWIGFDEKRDRELPPADLSGANWIAFPDDDAMNTPKGNRMFVTRAELPADDPAVQAVVLAAGDNKFWLAVNDKMIVHGEEGWERVKPVEITEALKAGKNEIRFNVENFESGPSGLVAKIRIVLQSGREIVINSGEGWLANNAPGHHWPARPVADSELTPCKAIAAYGAEPWGDARLQDLFLPPASLLRTGFRVEKPLASATLYASAMGLCDAYLNGQRVSEDFFTPGWSDYDKRIYYRSYDVTDRLTQGDNALGAELADGWFSGYVGWGRNRDHYGAEPRLRMQLHLAYQDGTSEIVSTNGDWKATDGPTREADFLMGERYDSGLAKQGWSTADYDDSAWSDVVVGSAEGFVVEPHPGPPVVAVEEFTPVSINEPQPGVYVFDLGQYIAGVARLKITGREGQQVQLRFAERLKPDGTLYTINLRGARTVDTFTCSGSEQEWTPRFTFHGFQYVEVTGVDSPPDESMITGIALSSDTEKAGSFECSDSMLNQLANNIYWTQQANFIDVPTDCPQRDERLGWTGDAQSYIASACLNNDVQAFFRKWLVDLADGQREDGQFPMVAPLKVAGDDGGPAWADAGVICPWEIYQSYGDLELLREQYPHMKRFVEFCRSRSRDQVLPPEEFHCFGDWLSVNADTPNDVIYAAYYAYCTRLLAEAAEVLGEPGDAAEYHELADQIRRAFQDEYVDAQGIVKGDTQCGYVLAIAHDLLTDEQRKLAADRLVADIQQRGNHLSTGFVGTKDLMLVLADIGRNDVAYELIHQDSYPSWGFSIAQGATSIWERWDGWTPEKGFQDPGMNSFAHYSFGAVYEWMVENIGGIRNGGDAYRHIEFRPSLDDSLGFARVSYDSIRGLIESSWSLEQGGARIDVTVPPNTTATLHLPCNDASLVKEAGQPINDRYTTASHEDNVSVELPSGKFSFWIAEE